VSRHEADCLRDIIAACAAIDRHLTRGDLSDGLVLDAVQLRLIEIGEAAKGLRAQLLRRAPEIPWQQVTGMKDWLTHHYFDVSPAIIEATVRDDLPPLAGAAQRLLEVLRVDDDE
jgi:uncharacterized protein with HEPN domain